MVEFLLSSINQEFILAKQEGLEFLEEISSNFDLEIEIKENIKFQNILGLGYSFEHSSCYNFHQLLDEDRRRAIEMLVDPINGAGMNLWRICVGTSDFTGTPWYSYDEIEEGRFEDIELKNFSIERDFEFIIPILKLAMEINPEILFFASPWSPPGWMKDSGKICGGRLLSKYYKIYADYLVKFILAYQEIGIYIHAITVQNEPGVSNSKMPSCKWRAMEEKVFIRDYLGPAIKSANLNTFIWCYDHNFGFLKLPTKYPGKILKDKEATKYIEGIAFHHYGGIPEYMSLIHDKFPDKNIYFTEGSVFGLKGAQKIVSYFLNGARSYNGWVPFIDTTHKPNNGPHFCTSTLLQLKVPENKIKVNFDYYLHCHFTKFIQRDAYRIFSTNIDEKKFNEVAFLNPDNSIVTILINKFSKEKIAKISWKDKNLVLKLPPNSIATLKWQNP